MLICVSACGSGISYFYRSGKRFLLGIGTRHTSTTQKPQAANQRTAVSQHRTAHSEQATGTGPHSSRAFGVWVSSVRPMSGAGQNSVGRDGLRIATAWAEQSPAMTKKSQLSRRKRLEYTKVASIPRAVGFFFCLFFPSFLFTQLQPNNLATRI